MTAASLFGVRILAIARASSGPESLTLGHPHETPGRTTIGSVPTFSGERSCRYRSLRVEHHLIARLSRVQRVLEILARVHADDPAPGRDVVRVEEDSWELGTLPGCTDRWRGHQGQRREDCGSGND